MEPNELKLLNSAIIPRSQESKDMMIVKRQLYSDGDVRQPQLVKKETIFHDAKRLERIKNGHFPISFHIRKEPSSRFQAPHRTTKYLNVREEKMQMETGVFNPPPLPLKREDRTAFHLIVESSPHCNYRYPLGEGITRVNSYVLENQEKFQLEMCIPPSPYAIKKRAPK